MIQPEAAKIEPVLPEAEEDALESCINDIEEALTKWQAAPKTRIEKGEYAAKISEQRRLNKYRKTWANVILGYIEIANDDYLNDKNLEKTLEDLAEKWRAVEKVTKDMIDEVENLAKEVLSRLEILQNANYKH